MKRVFLLFGMGSEYVLGPLAKALDQRGEEVVEIDMARVADPLVRLAPLRGRSVVFVTSAHLLLDDTNFRQAYTHQGSILSPLEVMGFLRPALSVFYPHDLGEPVLREESPLLSAFDLMLVPTRQMRSFADILPVEVVGWARLPEALRPPPGSTRGVRGLHVFSELAYWQREGFDALIEAWGPLWRLGLAVRLPPWPGAEEFERLLEQADIAVSPSGGDSFAAIEEADLVITNSLSSVSFEAAGAGRPVLNVVDGVHPPPIQRARVAGTPGVVVEDLPTAIAITREVLRGERALWPAPATLLPFDAETAIKSMLGRLNV